MMARFSQRDAVLPSGKLAAWSCSRCQPSPAHKCNDNLARACRGAAGKLEWLLTSVPPCSRSASRVRSQCESGSQRRSLRMSRRAPLQSSRSMACSMARDIDAFLPTTRTSDPAPLASGMKQRGHRGVRCLRLVRLYSTLVSRWMGLFGVAGVFKKTMIEVRQDCLRGHARKPM
jgi:hypothetical protein